MGSAATSKTPVDSLTRWWGPGPDWWAAACCWRGHCAGNPSQGRRGRCERCPGQRCRGCQPANPRPSRWAEPDPSAAAVSLAHCRSARFCTPAGQKRKKSCCSHFNVTDEVSAYNNTALCILHKGQGGKGWKVGGSWGGGGINRKPYTFLAQK